MPETVGVRVRFFGPLRELTGTRERNLRIAVGSTAADLVIELRSESKFSGLPERPTVAVNREYSSLERELHDGDEVAFIPPVAGG
ncbi:MAG: MoaD/ThiS family protein [Gemmatimonadota bacterium]